MLLGVRIRRVCLVTALSLAVVTSAFAETFIVQMTTVDFTPKFVPSDITIRPGDTVRWINADPYLMDHSTCSGTGSADPNAGTLWNSGTVRSGDYFEHTFAEVGDYAFFSIPHEFEGMFGMVRVTPSLDVPGGIEVTTWGRLKSAFRTVLPRE
jgi:plastocyanin